MNGIVDNVQAAEPWPPLMLGHERTYVSYHTQIQANATLPHAPPCDEAVIIGSNRFE